MKMSAFIATACTHAQTTQPGSTPRRQPTESDKERRTQGETQPDQEHSCNSVRSAFPCRRYDAALFALGGTSQALSSLVTGTCLQLKDPKLSAPRPPSLLSWSSMSFERCPPSPLIKC